MVDRSKNSNGLLREYYLRRQT